MYYLKHSAPLTWVYVYCLSLYFPFSVKISDILTVCCNVFLRFEFPLQMMKFLFLSSSFFLNVKKNIICLTKIADNKFWNTVTVQWCIIYSLKKLNWTSMVSFHFITYWGTIYVRTFKTVMDCSMYSLACHTLGIMIFQCQN